MKKYQNVQNDRKKSVFADVANQNGSEITFDVKQNVMTRNGGSVSITSGGVLLTMPKAVNNCVTECEAFRFTESVSLRFNVATFDLTALTALETEMVRVFAIVKAGMVGGVLPPVYADFEQA